MTSARSQAEVIAASKYSLLDGGSPRLEEVIWEDHYSMNGWNSLEEKISGAQREYVVKSVGYRIYEDERVVALTQTYSGVSENAAETMVILKSTIYSRCTLTNEKE